MSVQFQYFIASLESWYVSLHTVTHVTVKAASPYRAWARGYCGCTIRRMIVRCAVQDAHRRGTRHRRRDRRLINGGPRHGCLVSDGICHEQILRTFWQILMSYDPRTHHLVMASGITLFARSQSHTHSTIGYYRTERRSYGIDRTGYRFGQNGTARTLKINAPHPRCRQGCAGCGVNLLVQLPSSIGLRRAQGYLGTYASSSAKRVEVIAAPLKKLCWPKSYPHLDASAHMLHVTFARPPMPSDALLLRIDGVTQISSLT